MRAYLFYSDGQPIMSRTYTGPGKWYREQSFCDFERVLEEGEAPLVHMGHGHFHRFVCSAVDGKYALLTASNL